MPDQPAQSFANHTKTVFYYHRVLFALLTINLIWAIVRVFRAVNGVPIQDRLWAVVMALALVILALFARTFPLGAQDRIIRLEERLRYDALLPADLKARTGELTRSQIIALRFASDAELAELMRTVLDQKITRSKEIKQRIRSWRADHFRL
jgi:hypothetical protein